MIKLGFDAMAPKGSRSCVRFSNYPLKKSTAQLELPRFLFKALVVVIRLIFASLMLLFYKALAPGSRFFSSTNWLPKLTLPLSASSVVSNAF